MKKIFYLLCIVIALGVISCQQKKQNHFKIGISLPNNDLWHQAVVEELRHEASLYPDMEVDIRYHRNTDDEEQIDNISYFIDNKMDLMVVSAGNAALITPFVEKAYEENIPVIIFDQKIESDSYSSYVGGDNYRIGKDAGLFIVNLLQGRGNVVEIRGRVESATDIERHSGFTEVISAYPEINLVAQERADFNTRIADSVMTKVIKENKSVDVVFAMDDLTARGVHNAYNKAGIKQPFIIGVDALAGVGGGIDNILKGYQDISFIYPTGGDKLLEVAHNILTGKPYERNNILYTGIVDRSNAHLIQKQREHYFTERQKTDKVNTTLNQTLEEYSIQRIFFYISILIAMLVGVLLIISIRAYRSKSKSRARLAKQYEKIKQQNSEIRLQNEEIRRQSDILLHQKEKLEELSEKLKEATNAKLAFFTNISHEFKTPLSLILGPLKSLLDSGELSSKNKYLVELSLRNSEILLKLISQIIDFNKYENEKTTMNFALHDLKSFLSGLNELFLDFARQKQIRLDFQTDDESFWVRFDKEKMERVYLNILSNGFRFVPECGIIKISLRKEIKEGQEYAHIDIFNNGSLIPEEHINNIFNRFYKVNTRDAGTGIGLAIAGKFVELHHGKIYAYNKENEGVVFSILLPFVQEETDIPEVAFSKADPTGNLREVSVADRVTDITVPIAEEKPVILIIEDNTDMRNYIELILQNDYRIIKADNGKRGLEEAKKYLPDVIVSDVMMPEMDGLEVCRRIKENIPTCHIPVILLTARFLPEQEIEGLENGADIYITKPFDGNLLKVQLRSLIQNRKKIIEAFGQSFMNDSKSETLGNVEQEYINRIQDYVLENITDSDLDIETLAKDMGESYTRLYRKIKSLTGYTPVELVKIVRLKYAKRLLNLKTKNIATIAYEAGFSTPSYFTRCFKDFYKESPTEYLKKIQ